MKLFLDDIRSPYDDSWTLVRNANDCIKLLKLGTVTELSLDHDLGDNKPTGYAVVLWIERAVAYNMFIPPRMIVHSANPIGRKNMLKGIEQIKKISGGG